MEVELDEHIKIGFYTATILDWKKLLKPDKYKEIILGSLRFLVGRTKGNSLWVCHNAQPSSPALENRKSMAFRRSAT